MGPTPEPSSSTTPGRRTLTDEQFARLAEKVKTLFPLAPSSKHMSGRDLGRQEPTPTLRYRAAEVCACNA
jgi:hypothetical protein